MESLTSDVGHSSSQDGQCDGNEDMIWKQWAKQIEKDLSLNQNGWIKFELPDATIDLDKIQDWIRDCRTHHGQSCNNRYSDALAQRCGDLTLVDVIDGCIVDLPNTTPFVALSYVWGATEMPKLERSNRVELKQPGKLFAERVDDKRVPQVIKDAMHLLRMLNERYLWVDSLCVMQDMSKEDMDKTLQAMARIYASAEFTIVAAGGSDADHGLRGIGGPSRSRVPTHEMYCHDKFSQRRGYPYSTKWASRGWTFQESAFSHRLLVFDSLVSWVCGRCVWQEEVFDKSRHQDDWLIERSHADIPMGMLELIPPYPDLERWGDLVGEFSSRTLKYEKDFVEAFAGATNSMAPMFPGGLIQGLPKFFFDIALLWQPKSGLSRRPEGPSWSWTGWKGRTFWGNCPNFYRPPAVELKPVAIYQSIGTTSVNIPDLNKFYDYQALRKQPDDMLPAGWKRTQNSFSTYYTNPAIGDRLYKCSYPLPLSLDTFGRSSTSVCTPLYLMCTASIATLSISKQEMNQVKEPLNFAILLENAIVGVLIANEKHEEMSRTGEQLPCELVAISEAEVHDNYGLGRYFDFYRPACDWHIDDSSASPYIVKRAAFYNVLWVHWENNIAYRKGVGAVNKAAWDSIGAEVRTFKLG
jgi:hypothetical protein